MYISISEINHAILNEVCSLNNSEIKFTKYIRLLGSLYEINVMT